jgi:hypothetical protein
VNTPAKGKIKMKVGFSLGRCIRDIVNDIVTYDDVAFIITGTALRDEDAIKLCVSEYMWRQDYLYGIDEEVCQALALRLFTEGKLFQLCITTPGTVCISSKGIPLAIGLLIVSHIKRFGI